MLTRTQAEPLTAYNSPLLTRLSCPHAFSTRLGGVSPARDSLDLGLAPCAGRAPSAIPPDIAENYRRLHGAVGCERARLVWVQQVHRAGVVVPDASWDKSAAPPEADALVTSTPGLLLSIRVADCVPVLLAARGRAPGTCDCVAAAHAGWRGVVAGVVPATLRVMRERFGADSSRVVAAIGPCIGVERFEVGPEVAEAFDAAGLGAAVCRSSHAKPRIDLAAAVAAQLRRAGVPEASIDRTDRCTFRDADEFFSHRRDQGKTGRMAAVIAMPWQAVARSR